MDSSCTLPLEILTSSPSLRDGIEPNEEVLHRVFGCELIQEAGILLRTSQVVMVTGQNLLHRFFYRKSLRRFDVFTVAMGCFLLASKVEEKPKILREVLYVFFQMYHFRKCLKLRPLELGGIRYTTWKNEVIMIERYILKELGFSFYQNIEHPHKYLLYYIKVLDGSDSLAQTSWNYLNDASRLDLCLRYETRVIACAAIHLAAQELHFPLPGGGATTAEDRVGSGEDCAWWCLFGVDLSEIISVGDMIVHLYEIPKLTWLEPIAEVAYLSPEECAKYDESCLTTTTATSHGERDFGPEHEDQGHDQCLSGHSQKPHSFATAPSLRMSESPSTSPCSSFSESAHHSRISNHKIADSHYNRRNRCRRSRSRSKSSNSGRTSNTKNGDRGSVRDRSRDRDRDRDEGRDRDSGRNRGSCNDRDRGMYRDKDRDRRRGRDGDRSRSRDRDRNRESYSRRHAHDRPSRRDAEVRGGGDIHEKKSSGDRERRHNSRRHSQPRRRGDRDEDNDSHIESSHR